MIAGWLWIAGGVAAAVGVLLVAFTLLGAIAFAGAGLYVLGCAFWVIYAYLRSLDPLFSTRDLWMEAAFAWLTMFGLALLGIVFLQSGLPRGVSFVNLGYSLLFLLAFFILRARKIDVFPPQGVFLVSLPMGIVALKSKLLAVDSSPSLRVP